MTGSMTRRVTGPAGALAALQRCLAGEHAALYVYGVLGGQVSDSTQPDLAARLDARYLVHRGRRDRLTALVTARGADPVAARVSYVLPDPARTPAELERAARVTEVRCTDLYAESVGATSGAERRWAVAALTESAVAVLALGERPDPFPGVREL